jgi:penicillin-binding protein 2
LGRGLRQVVAVGLAVLASLSASAMVAKKHGPTKHAAIAAHRGTVRSSSTHARAATSHARAAATRGRASGRAARMSERPAGRGRGARVLTARVVVHGRVVRRSRYFERFSASSFADNLTAGDVTAGEDPIVRQAAITALGDMNGTALAIDPATGRILAMVNQKLALSAGAEPCSTIKVSVALAALKEGLITANTPVNLGGHYSLDLTHAMAKSVNLYFEVLGRAMGFDRVKHYANMFGLGELAGYNIPGEHLGVYPNTELPQASGGVGKMCSFGESISMTPLQLGALVGAVANGGTLYYLQHPKTQSEVASFQPKVKRQLDIAGVIPQILPGMAGAVEFPNGTARSLRTNFVQFPVFGKTGTCSNLGTRFGWFVSYADTPKGRIVTVIFLEGGRPTFGPKAAELTGEFYRAMYEGGYFGPQGAVTGASAGR